MPVGVLAKIEVQTCVLVHIQSVELNLETNSGVLNSCPLPCVTERGRDRTVSSVSFAHSSSFSLTKAHCFTSANTSHAVPPSLLLLFSIYCNSCCKLKCKMKNGQKT